MSVKIGNLLKFMSICNHNPEEFNIRLTEVRTAVKYVSCRNIDILLPENLIESYLNLTYLCKMLLNRRIFSLWVGVLLIVLAGSCKSKFEKLRASNNIAMKYQEAVKLYEKKKYSK